ncbi:DUF4435 domain-containing protein [Aeromonas sp. QDB62]|uniref:DUF4435 domain-containing protein n=1 Tax=Aeromonas sp. QDB62 TaxID=2990499 RepID=UPI0022E77B6A|nr:DUF4435 domain-containing protein [Aeromonas sp. QDB62]
MLEQINAQMSRSAVAISIHKFKLLKNKKTYVFLFLEGEDDVYFYPQNAKNMYHDKYILPLNCDGKDGVIEANEVLSKDLGDCIVGFFVDKDFDEQKNPSIPKDVYITPTYSVENIVYNRETFINFLIGRFLLLPTDDGFTKCLKLYDSLSMKFYESIRLYNMWIYAQRNYATVDKAKKLNLPKCLPTEFIHVTNANIEAKYDLNLIETKHPTAPKLTQEMLRLADEALKNINPELTFRGKFNWHFFSYILGLLIDDANDERKRTYLNTSVKFNVSRRDPRKLFEEISPFAKPPECLLQYLNKINA